MKSTFRTINLAKWKQKWFSMITTGRAFLWMSAASAAFFIVVSIGGIVGQQFLTSPASSMKGIAAQLSAQWFAHMLSLELPAMKSDDQEAVLSKRDVANMIVRLVTNVNPQDPKTLLAGELPGAIQDTSVLLRPGSGNPNAVTPEDLLPMPEDDGAEHGGVPNAEDTTPLNNNFEKVDPNSGKPMDDPTEANGLQNKVVMIYHSHNRESWNPELTKETDNPNDAKTNITLVGKYLQKQLEKQGIGALHSNKDYSSTIKDYNWNYSYKYSGDTVKEAMAGNDKLQFFFDIHRDSAKRQKTTVTIDGKSYAKVYFIIGHRNPNWRDNEKFAAAIHDQLEKKYPGISKGIFGKTAQNGNGEYNQSLSSNSVLIEIGGVDNTLDESYRTANVLAEIIAGIIHEQEGVQSVDKTVEYHQTKTENKA